MNPIPQHFSKLVATVGVTATLWFSLPLQAHLAFETFKHQVELEPYQHELVQHDFVFTNEGTEAVRVRELVDIRGTATLTIEPKEVPPGASGRLTVKQPMDQLGESHYRYALITDEADVDRYRVTISAFIQSAYSPEALLVDFGFIDPRQDNSSSFELSSREVAEFRILGAEAAPEGGPTFVSPNETEQPKSEAKPRLFWSKGANLGLQTGKLVLNTNIEHQPKFVVDYRANFFARVVPSEHPINLGLSPAGQPIERAFSLHSRDGSAIEIEKIEAPDAEIQATEGPCPGRPAELACRRLKLTANSAKEIVLGNILHVFVANEEEPVPISYSARFVPANTRIKKVVIPAATEPAAGAAP